MEPGFVSMTEACEFLGIGRSTGYELVERGEFPVPVQRLGRRIVVARKPLLELAQVAS